MFRAQYVGNKACASREKKRWEDQHKQRLRDMKPAVDTRTPQTSNMAHLKTNLKRNQLVAERYDTIERDNQILLTKMAEMAIKGPDEMAARHSRSLPSLRHTTLGGVARRREHERIDKENAHLLRRLQNCAPTVNRMNAEAHYQRSMGYMKLKCEYPLPQYGKNSSRMLSPLKGAGKTSPANAGAPVSGHFDPRTFMRDPDVVGEELKYVLTKEMRIADVNYIVEMASDTRVLAISLYHVEGDGTLEMIVNEDDHRMLYDKTQGDYHKIAVGLQVENDCLTLDTDKILATTPN